ncbi:MAG: cation:proton antiporter [Gammaproteobacteria bacterium]|nr:cation:proton antiporter [Gammaproteobacteria bacterium]MBU1655504.1 cation:proton antiporter [Gammaproteobacteria bacterium]MBU1960821.1 cation:proton antiporter [Gammaproteobacteria bacterium]
MEAHSFFLQLLIILLTARLFAEIATRLKAPSVIGELLAGVVLGPSLLGFLAPSEVFQLLAEVGIILLLFDVGLDTDVRRLAHAGSRAAVVAVVGFLLPFLLGFGVSHGLFGFPLLPALFIGGTLTATSIGITLRVLTDLHRRDTPEAQVVLGAAVIDDILGVVLLALLYDFSTSGGISLINAGQVLFFIGIFFALAPFAARIISLVIRHFDTLSETPGLIPTSVVSLVLFFAWLAHAVGAPELLGGFAAGLALSRRFFLPFGVALHQDPDFAHRIENQLRPIAQLFTPIFFVMVGLSLDLRAIDWGEILIWGLSLSLLLAAALGKLSAALVVSGTLHERLAIGLAMLPRGEVGLIFAELGQKSGILNPNVYAALVIVIAMTTLAAPLLLKRHYARIPRIREQLRLAAVGVGGARMIRGEAAFPSFGTVRK